MALLRWLGIAVVALVVALFVVGIAARFADGPVGILPGGPLVAGPLVTETEVDFSFAEDVREIEFQLLDPPRSRTVWIVVLDGELFIPCGFLGVPLFKQWPHEALEDGRALLRIEGKRYERSAERVMEPELFRRLAAMNAEKYGLPEPAAADPETAPTWFFRMAPRRS